MWSYSSLMNPLFNEIKNDITGLAALHDWLGEGGEPVHPMVAEFRAQRCCTGDDGKGCPLNKGQGWLETAKGAVSNWIRREMELKEGMELHVTTESHLHVCKACGCYLRLKVWVPRDHVRKHTTKEQLEQMPSYCWIKSENK